MHRLLAAIRHLLAAIRHLLGAIRRLLDALLPTPPDDTAYAATEAEAAHRRWRVWYRRFERGSRGGNR